jgi:hypothetical protein
VDDGGFVNRSPPPSSYSMLFQWTTKQALITINLAQLFRDVGGAVGEVLYAAEARGLCGLVVAQGYIFLTTPNTAGLRRGT